VTAVDRQTDIRGITLHRREWRPTGQPRAVMVLIHGQGDAIDRYECSVVRRLVAHGIACTGIDFPGHGRSPGKRGDIPDLAFARATMHAACDAAAHLAPGAPVGVFAHSMGGLLAIDWLAAPDAPRPAFLWLSSPLVNPRHRQPKLLLTASRILGQLAPWLTLHSRVRPGDCRRDDPQIDLSPAIATLHDRIRLGWAIELLAVADRLSQSVASLPARLPVLLTQGLADPVCPADFARRLFAALPCAPKRLVEIPAARHEPFDDSCRDQLLAAAAAWLEETLAA